MDSRKLSHLVASSCAGEVIDKSWWNEGAEWLYTCARHPMRSSFPAFPAAKRTTSRDLLLTRNGTPYVHIPIEGCIYSNVVQRIQLKEGLNRKYISYALQAAADENLRGEGVSIASLNYELWAALRLHVPTFDAQTAIANYLDAKTAAIDALIAKKELLIEELKKYQEAVITETVLGVRQQESKVKAGEAADVFAGYSEYPLLPAKRIFQRKKQLNEGMACTNRLSLTMNGVIPRELDDAQGLQATEYETYQRVEQGDLLFKLIDLENIKTSRVGLVPAAGIVSPAYIRLSARHTELDVEYFYWYFYALYLNNVFNSMGGGVRQALGPTELLDILIPVPPRDTRAKIVSELTAKVEQFKAVVASAANGVTELKRYRAALISEAVTGKLKLAD